MTKKLNKQFRQAVPWTVLDGLFNLVYSIGMLYLLGKFVSPIELGLASAALAVVQLIESSYNTGLQESVVRAHSGHTSLTDSAHAAALILSLLAALICCAVAWPLAVSYHDEQIFWLICVASIILPLNGMYAIPTAILSRKIRVSVLTRRLMMGKVFAATAFIIGVLLHLGAWSIILSCIASSFGSLCLMYFSVRRWPKLRVRREEARSLMRYAIVSSAGTFCWMGTMRLFALVFGFFHGIAALGNFQFALRLVDELAAMLQITVTRVGLSYFAGLKRSESDLSNAFLSGTRVLNMLAAPVYTGVILIASDLLAVLFGDRWSAAVPMLWVLALAWIITFPKILAPTVLKAHGKPSLPLIFALVEAVVAFSSIIFTAYLTPLAAVLGWALARVSSLPLELSIMRREFSLPIIKQLQPVVPALAASGFMAVAVLLFRHYVILTSPVANVCASIVVGGLSYGVLIIMFDPCLIPLLRSIWGKRSA